MSFLDNQTTTAGQIALGTKRADLGLLLPRTRQASRQQQTQGYDILPSTAQTIPGIVSTPTDITQVGVGEKLQQQGTTASQVTNVFEKYKDTGAGPLSSISLEEALFQNGYLEPSPDDEIEEIVQAANEEFANNFGYDPYDPQTDQGLSEIAEQTAAEASQGQMSTLYSELGLGAGTIASLEIGALGGLGLTSLVKGAVDTVKGNTFEGNVLSKVFDLVEDGKLEDQDGNKIDVDDVFSALSQIGTGSPVVGGSGIAAVVAGRGQGGSSSTAAAPVAPVSTPSSQSFMGIDPGIDPGIPSVSGDAGTDIGISGFSGTTADFGLD
tara:strand:- start:51 stop:1022 length:972 start_codon:yes stop_codon:yes gene_type:complete